MATSVQSENEIEIIWLLMKNPNTRNLEEPSKLLKTQLLEFYSMSALINSKQLV